MNNRDHHEMVSAALAAHPPNISTIGFTATMQNMVREFTALHKGQELELHQWLNIFNSWLTKEHH